MKRKKPRLFEELYATQILRLYDAENLQQRTLHRFEEAADSDELGSLLLTHLEETKTQICRLEEIIADFADETQRFESRTMRAIVSDAEEFIGAGLDPDLLDAALIGSLMTAESHEISCYAGAIQNARSLGRSEDVSLLSRSLQEEKVMANRLSALAQSHNRDMAEAEELIATKKPVRRK